MKKFTSVLSTAAILSMASVLGVSCSNIVSQDDTAVVQDISRAAKTYTSFKTDSGASSYNSTYGFYTITGSKVKNGWNYASIDLSAFNGKTVKIEFSSGMHVNNKSSSAVELAWCVNTDGYPVVAKHSFPAGNPSDWPSVTGSATVKLGSNNVLYLSTYNTTPSKLDINLSGLSVKVTEVSGGSSSSGSSSSSSTTTYNNYVGANWLKVSPLKSAFKNYFSYFGLETSQSQLESSEVQKGLKYHVNSITMENELKPDFFFNWATPNTNGTFKSSKGKTIKVPTNCPDFSRLNKILTICKNTGVQMRGHVFVWHSQTPTAFFRQNYNKYGSYVSKDEMDARQEWYIKTILDYVKNWEKNNNGGKHIIWAWDVVNEAVADDANGNNWLRGSTSGSSNMSDWYKVYKNSDFIVNAFRYANKYAPSDVKLCYNDYNCYLSGKTDGIIKLLNSVKNASKDSWLPSRIDAIGMQSHVSYTYPTVSAYESAMKKFINLGLDVHVSEFDIANGNNQGYNANTAKNLYRDYFKVFVNNRKTSSKKGVTSVTLWGVNDEESWLQSSYTRTQYPLLFKKSGSSYAVKDEYIAVLNSIGLK